MTNCHVIESLGPILGSRTERKRSVNVEYTYDDIHIVEAAAHIDVVCTLRW